MRLFRRRKPGSMQTTPVNNPLHYRSDGSIRPGDPAWDFFQEVMKSGKVGIAHQRDDGTWETEFVETEGPAGDGG